MKVYENGSLKSTATFRAFAGKRGLGGVSLGVAVPEKYFTFLVPGGNHDGVKVAVGFLAPSTVPSYKPNLNPRFGARHRCFQTLVEPWAGLHAGGCAAASLRHRPAPAFAFAFRAFATVLLLLDCYCAD